MARGIVWAAAVLLAASSSFAELQNVEVAADGWPWLGPFPPQHRLIVNNDGTNLFWRDDLTMDMVRRHAAECPDAVTTYMVCPNGIHKMMYPSALEELSTRGALPALVAQGEDPFGAFLAALKTRGFEVFITFRMNEVHNVDQPNEPDLCAFWRDHPEWHVQPDAPLGNWMAHCLDYSRPEVRDRTVALVSELLEKYRPDGVELDWMRFPRHLSGTPEQVWEKRGALTEVVEAVRKKAGELSKRLAREVKVSVRVPTSAAGCRALGVDLGDWAQRGLVDFVTASPFLASDFHMPLAELRALIGKDMPLYAAIEIGHSGRNHTEASLHAAGLGLYGSGADGLYLFNFPCWRETQEAPPWSWVPPLRDPQWLTLGALDFPLINGAHRVAGVDLTAPLPLTVPPKQTVSMVWPLPRQAVEKAAVLESLRLTLDADAPLAARLNGEAPGENGALPAAALRAGDNTLELQNNGDTPVVLQDAHLLLAFPPAAPVFPTLPEEQCVYVSPAGSDSNPGTREAPVATLEGAAKAFQGRGTPPQGTEQCVWVAGGTYDMNGLGKLLPGYLEGGCKHLYLRAFPGETPVFSAGWPVGGWKDAGDGRWKSGDVGHEKVIFCHDMLYVNNRRAVRARAPFPETWERWGDYDHVDGEAGYRIPGTALVGSKPGNLAGVVYFNSWAHMVCPIREIRPDGDGGTLLVMRQPDFFLAHRKEGAPARDPSYIEGLPPLVDEPGEFCFDDQERVFLYKPRDGETMDSAVAVAGGRGCSLYAQRYEVRLSIWSEGITFSDVDSSLSDRGHVDVQSNYCLNGIPSNIIERNGSIAALHNEFWGHGYGMFLGESVLSRCVFKRFGVGSLRVDGGATLHQCVFEDIGGTAVTVGGVSREDHHPSFRGGGTGDVVISECVFRNCGVEYEGSVGVFVGYANGVVIARNEFYDLPYSAISVGWGWGEEDAGGGAYDIPFRYATPTPCGANRILDNHIHHVMQKRDDGAAVYTLGNQPGTLIRGNHIHDNGPGGPGGVYLDEGSGFIEVTGNRVYNVKRPMNFNNHAQDRRATCFVHDNDWDDTLNN